MDDDGTAPAAARSRPLYVVAAGACGFGIGGSLVVAFLVGGRGGAVAGVLIWLALLAAVLVLEKRVPADEEVTRWTRIGFGTSVVLYLVAAMPWLSRQDEVGWGHLLAGALVVAAPCLIAAGLVARHD